MQLGHRARSIGASIFLILLVGCGGSGNVKVYRVQGKVMFEGKPMRGGGTIAFVPIGNQAGKAAGGEIAEDGTYQLTTYRQGDGSMLGEFRIVITQIVEKEPEPTKDGEKVQTSTQVVPKAERIPTIYADHQKSPLTTKVEPKSPNEIDFNLKRDAQLPEQKQRGA